MKRVNTLYEKITTFENVLLASKKARAGRKIRASTLLFEYKREKNIFKIIEVLINKTYSPGNYKEFYIYDPKKRLISAAPYFDRVIHHALINIIGPVLEKSFIYDSYACIKNRGTHKAIDRYKEFQAKNRYVLKCDIVKYFQNIDHEILFDTLKNKVKCKDTLWLLRKIIGVTLYGDEPDGRLNTQRNLYSTGKKGIPIGNLTSQFFANLYLNGFDHYVKEKVRAKYYIRYCDDFVVLGNSKEFLAETKVTMANYLNTIKLALHENKSRIYRTTDGVDFLGFRIYPHHMRVRKRVVKGYRRKLKIMALDFENG